MLDGTTICATIHSPTQFAFSMFDNLLMMVKGRVIYFGEPGAFQRCLRETRACQGPWRSRLGWCTITIIIMPVSNSCNADRRRSAVVAGANTNGAPIKYAQASLPSTTNKLLGERRCCTSLLALACKTGQPSSQPVTIALHTLPPPPPIAPLHCRQRR